MLKGYKVRLYPTKEQEQCFWRHIGACRYIWNYMLEHQERHYVDGGKYLSAFDMACLIKPLKNDGIHEWLYNVSGYSLVTICRDLDKAYRAFFRKERRHPKYKSRKRSKASYPIRADRTYFNSKIVQIEKVGRVKYKTDFDLPVGRGSIHMYNPHVSFDDFKWYLSFNLECENQASILTETPMGIDLGIKDLAVVAFGDERMVFHNINKSKKMRVLEKRIVRVQRSVSRKYEANKTGNVYHKTNNIEREELKLRRLRKRQSDIRHNYIHQVTHMLVSKLPCRIVMEDLNVTGMMKNRHLAKAVQDQGFAEFVRQIQYKCEWNCIPFVQADRFYPSSKTCSACGSIKNDLKLSDRTFVCQECGFMIDRDYNAAINLMRYTDLLKQAVA